MDLATLGLRVDASGAIQELRNFAGASEQAGRSAAGLDTATRRSATGIAATHGALGMSAEQLGKKFEHLGVAGAFAISNLANGSEDGMARVVHSLAMIGFAFGPMVGAATTAVAVILEQFTKLSHDAEQKAKEFGKSLADAIRQGQAEELAKQQKLTAMDLLDAQKKLADETAKLDRGQRFIANQGSGYTLEKAMLLPKTYKEARERVDELLAQQSKLNEALDEAATRAELLADRGANGQRVLLEATKEYADLVKEATKALYDRATAARVDFEVASQHYDLLVKTAAAQQKLNQLTEQAAQQADPLYRINHALSMGAMDPKRIGLTETGGTAPGSLLPLAGSIDSEIALRKRESQVIQQIIKGEAEFKDLLAVQSAARELAAKVNALRQFQEIFTHSIASMLDGSMHTWEDFFGNVARMGANLIGNAIATQLAKLGEKTQGIATAGLGGFGVGYGSQSPLMGAVGGAMAGAEFGPPGMIVGAVAGIVGGLIAQGQRAREAQAEFDRASDAWQASIEKFSHTITQLDPLSQTLANNTSAYVATVNGFVNDLAKSLSGQGWGGQVVSLAASGAGFDEMLASLNDWMRFATLFGDTKAAEEIQKTIGAVTRLSEVYKRNADAAREAAKFNDFLFARDLEARRLRAAGMTDEAAQAELWNRHVREFADAVRKGVDEMYLAELAVVQERERQNLVAMQAADAARKLAEAEAAQAEAAKKLAADLADIQVKQAEAAHQFGQSMESLAIRLLNATGLTAEGSRRALLLQQQKELYDAQHALDAERNALLPQWNYLYAAQRGMAGIDAGTAALITAQVAAFQEKEKQQREYLAELQRVQAAELTAFDQQQSMPGATAATGSAIQHTIVSRTTAAQGDRMVDELTTARVLQATYLPYLKDIATALRGGVNKLLGGDLVASQALAGSALLT